MPEHIRQEPKVLVSTENLTEQEWLAYRRQGIGGSDVAAILGISPFRTARDLYDDKLNIASAVDDTGNWVALEMGHLLEPLVAQIFTKKTGLEVFQIKKMFQHPQYPFMLADVDYFVRLPNGKIALLEIKTTNYNAKDHWWKDGEEYVPVYYETQGRHYMAVMDMDEIFYCCLYGNNEDEAIIRHLYRDREYEQEMVYLEREFWHDHILFFYFSVVLVVIREKSPEIRDFPRQPARQRDSNRVCNGLSFSEWKLHLFCDLHKTVHRFFRRVAGVRCRVFTLPALLSAIFGKHSGVLEVPPPGNALVHYLVDFPDFPLLRLVKGVI